MSIYRRDARRDGNEAAVVEALEAVGASVTRISGAGVPDLLVGYHGQTYLLEVKTKDGTYTPAQVEFRAGWRGGPCAVVRDGWEALRVLGLPARFQAGDRPWEAP